MAKNLVIVESPSKAKTIEKILGNNYEVVASFGHIIDLPKTTLGIDINNNFSPKYMVLKDRKDLIKTLKEKSKKSNYIYLASDLDREGEAIAWHISNILLKENPKIKRIEFNEITKSAIIRAVNNPRNINMDLVNSQQARRLLDRLVGYEISPLLWSVVGKDASAGRVQSVALKLVCDLEKEILNFISKKYYEVSINIKDEIVLDLVSIDGENIDKIYDKKILDKLLNDLDKSKINIEEVKISKKTQKPPVIFKTSTLQQLASTYLGYNASKTMRVAQRLYEGLNIGGDTKGLITYMRTDSIRVADEAKQMAKKYIEKNYGKEYVGNYYVSNSKGAQDAHEGIRPTDIELTPEYLKSYLSNDEYKLYKLIWDRFLVSQFASVKYEQMQIIATKLKYKFRGNINKIIFDGYYKVSKSSDDITSVNFPDIKVNESYIIDKLNVKEGDTKAPSRYTEASLIKKLESLGIGRPSTYATIIDAIKDKNYVEVVDKKLLPTIFGKEVESELSKNFKNIMNVKFTAELENHLDEVANGNLNWTKLLEDFYKKLNIEMEKYKKKVEELKNKLIYTDVKCTNSNSSMVLKTGRYGKYLVCEVDSDDKISIKGIEIDKEEIEKGYVKIKDKLDKLLNNKKGIDTNYFTDNGSRYLLKVGRFGEYLESENFSKDNLRLSLSKEIRLKLKKNSIKIEDGILLIKEELEKINEINEKLIKDAGKCEKCGSNFIIKTGRYGKFLACSSYPECKNMKAIVKKKTSKKKG